MTSWLHGTIAPWGALLMLGAFHGINPAMGWLLAVALGMQENRSRAVWRALVPLGIGHACAIAVAIFAAILAGVVIPTSTLRWLVAAILITMGIRRLFRQRHPRGGGMRMGAGDLTMWSFLVATAHGAGLMVLPVWLGASVISNAESAEHLHGTADLASGLVATAIHGGSYLIVTAVTAWLVFTRLGVGLLRKAWINLDLIWAAALIMSGGLMLLLPSPHAL